MCSQKIRIFTKSDELRRHFDFVRLAFAEPWKSAIVNRSFLTGTNFFLLVLIHFDSQVPKSTQKLRTISQRFLIIHPWHDIPRLHCVLINVFPPIVPHDLTQYISRNIPSILEKEPILQRINAFILKKKTNIHLDIHLEQV